MTDENNPPAFPKAGIYTSDLDTIEWVQSGMTLRDYFAGQALAASISHNKSVAAYYENFAAEAYQYADAMLKARCDAKK